jgi:hypothetical protein
VDDADRRCLRQQRQRVRGEERIFDLAQMSEHARAQARLGSCRRVHDRRRLANDARLRAHMLG